MLCASYSRNPWEGRYWPVIDYVIIVDTQHTNILINTDRISESQKIDKNSALICSGKLSDIINIKKIYAWPSLLHFEFELNMSSSDDLLSQALIWHNNNSGPNTVPWGTPYRTISYPENTPSTSTRCLLSTRNYSTHALSLPSIP